MPQILAPARTRPTTRSTLIDDVLRRRSTPTLGDLRPRSPPASRRALHAVHHRARDGVAEVFYTIAGALQRRGGGRLHAALRAHRRAPAPRSYRRAAAVGATAREPGPATIWRPRPTHRVPRDSPARIDAPRSGRAEALRASGDKAEARSRCCEALAESRPDHAGGPRHPGRHAAPRGALRRGDRGLRPRHRASRHAAGQTTGSLFFARGITHEREDRWDAGRGRFPQGAGAATRTSRRC